MQEFIFENMKAQNAAPEPYTIYDKGKSLEEPKPENLTLRDFEYFKSMYPARMKDLQLHVEAVCDEMDYEGSCLYDEYPDRVMVEQLKKKVELRLAKEDLTGTKQTVIRNEAAEAAQPEAEASASPAATELIQSAAIKTAETLPRTSYGPQAVRADAGNNRRREMEALLRRETEPDPVLEAEERRPDNRWGPPPRPGNPWGPPPPPPRPGNPWGPPPPPPRPGNPWGPPPPPPRPGNPWGPPPPPPRPGNPWGPPPPPPRPGTPPWGPWGPPHWGPPPRPDHKSILGDMISLLLFGEMQRRRCRSRICR